MKCMLIASLVSARALTPMSYAADAHYPDKDKPAAVSADMSSRIAQMEIRMDMMQMMMQRMETSEAPTTGTTK